MNQRETALEILYKTIRDESYSNLLMRKKLNELPVVQRAFVTNLCNSVLRKYEILNYQFAEYISGKTSLRMRLILAMAVYERFYLQEKDYVVNNEYCQLGKNEHEKGFINAVLHKCTSFKEADAEDINACLPKWIYQLLSRQYEPQELQKIIQVYQSIPQLYYRLNKKKAAYKDLEHLDITIINEDSFISRNNLLDSAEYKKGYFYVQDVNSASLYKQLDLNAECLFLDVCSAPGSKLFNALDIVKEENAYANDLHAKRVELIRKMAGQLGFQGIHYLNEDGCKLPGVLDQRFDRILLDAPCSGLGVLSRKPDLKFHIRSEDLDELQQLQKTLLNSCMQLLKPDGILLYSTCTLNRKENDKQISSFLKENEDMQLLQQETIINDQGDCFYYAKMKKVK